MLSLIKILTVEHIFLTYFYALRGQRLAFYIMEWYKQNMTDSWIIGTIEEEPIN